MTRTGIVGALAFPALFASAEPPQWATTLTEDDFTDEKIWLASVNHETGGQTFTLFVNCRDSETVNIGLAGTYINPTGGEREGSLERYTIPVRFDDNEVSEEEFTEQDNMLFLSSAVARLIAKLADSPNEGQGDDASKGYKHIFVKKLADHSRLRIKFPQHKGDVVLDFTLVGAKDALLEAVNGCQVAASDAPAFVDDDDNSYATLADLVLDDTWLQRWKERTESAKAARAASSATSP